MLESFANLLILYPPFKPVFEEEYKKLTPTKLTSPDYTKFKLKLIMVDLFLVDEAELPQEMKEEIVIKIFQDTQQGLKDWVRDKWNKFSSFFARSVDDPHAKGYEEWAKDYDERAKKKSDELDDIDFLKTLTDETKYGGSLAAEQIRVISQIASSILIEKIPPCLIQLGKKFHKIRHTIVEEQIKFRVSRKRDDLYAELCSSFVQAHHDAQQETQLPERS